MDLQSILQVIKDEPEYPGQPPEELRQLIVKALHDKDADLVYQALRATVVLTKRGIKYRMIEAWNARPADGVVELIEFTHNLLGEYNALPDEWEHFELIKSIIMENKKALAALGGE